MIFESNTELEIGDRVWVSEYEEGKPAQAKIPGKVIRMATLEEFLEEAKQDDPLFSEREHLYRQHRPWAFHYEISVD
jgi:hypothetical protein